VANEISDGNIRYFEFTNDKFEYLSEHKSADPQRGIAFVPKRGVNVSLTRMNHFFCTDSLRYMKTKSPEHTRPSMTATSNPFPSSFLAVQKSFK
jgi:coronin-1B/1C/6